MQKNIIQYIIEYDTIKSVGDGLDFCYLCTEFPQITLVKYILRRIVKRDNSIGYIFNKIKKTRRIINNNKIKRDTNHNQEHDLIKSSSTARSKLGGYGSTTNGGTGSIFLASILDKSGYANNDNTNSYMNDGPVKVSYLIDIDSDSDEGSNCDIEDSDFMVDNEDIANFCEEVGERNFMSKDFK